MKLLNLYLNWNLNLHTTYHSTELLLAVGLVFRDDTINGNTISKRILSKIQSCSSFYSDLSTECASLKVYSSLIKGVACILCARRMCKLDIIWNNRITKHTGISYSDAKEAYLQLYNFYERTYKSIKSKNKSMKTLKTRRKALTRNTTFRKADSSTSQKRENLSIRSIKCKFLWLSF